MAIIASKPKGGSFLTPSGTHQAVCYAVWDIGLQKTTWNGEDKFLNKIIISWEINEKIDDPEGEYHGKRYVTSRFYTLSLASKANLKKDLEAWRGKAFTGNELAGFDVETVIGANCLLSIIHRETEENTYANVSAIMPLPKNTEPMKPENNTEPPEWVKKLQAEGRENLQAYHDNHQHSSFQEPAVPPFNDDYSDLPF